jgi:CTP:molybdopterin cytidylyltransferase MocA
MKTYAILLPAAGASSRMKGRDKLLEDCDGEPLLRRIAKRALATGSQVFVTLPDHGEFADARRAALVDLGVTIIPVPDPQTGMAASFRAVAPYLEKVYKGLLIALPDMPEITGQDMALLLSAHAMFPDAPILRAATKSGKAGHPVLLPEWCFSELSSLTGDQGPRDILKKHEAKLAMIPLADERAVLDLDTPQDWAKWRATK